VAEDNIDLSKLKISRKQLLIIPVLIILIAVFFIFSFTGLKLFLGFILLIFYPAYLISKLLDIDENEKLFFSFFIGIIFMPLLLWYIDRLIRNIVLSAIITAVLVYAIALIIKYKDQIFKKN
jgi:hypothetical protein